MKFVVLSSQRSGSTWVIDMLNSHPRIVAYSELFMPGEKTRPTYGGAKDIILWNAYRKRLPTRRARPVAIFDYLDRVVYSATANESMTVGFKLMYDHLFSFPELVLYARRRKLALVHLVRDNLLDMLISKARMKATGTAHAYAESERVRVDLDTAGLVRRLDRMSRERSLMRGLGRILRVPYQEYVYEELAAGGSGAFNDLVTFLGQDPEEPMTSALRKINVEPQALAVSNFEAVRQVLAPTPHARFLRLAPESRP